MHVHAILYKKKDKIYVKDVITDFSILVLKYG